MHNQDDEGDTSLISLRGNEQIVHQPSQLRIMSRAIFIRKVLDQQDYENRKTNTESCVEDRLAAKVRRWSMPSVDQAIMRAQVGVTENQSSWSIHPVLENDTQIPSRTCSTSAKVANNRFTTPLSALVSNNRCYPEDMVRVSLTINKNLAYDTTPSLKELFHLVRAPNLQVKTFVRNAGTARCA